MAFDITRYNKITDLIQGFLEVVPVSKTTCKILEAQVALIKKQYKINPNEGIKKRNMIKTVLHYANKYNKVNVEKLPEHYKNLLSEELGVLNYQTQVATKHFLEVMFNREEYFNAGLSIKDYRSIFSIDRIKSVDVSCFERVSLNPLVETREDKNVTSFRNILIESDTLSLDDQVEFFKRIGIPFNIVVFSGNKSYHVVICLEESLADLPTYNYVCKWLFRIMGSKLDLVDSKNSSPSRAIRMLGGVNQNTNIKQKGKVVNENRIPVSQLLEFLFLFAEHAPQIINSEFSVKSGTPNPALLKPWITYGLKEGIHSGKRNAFFYEAGFSFAESGYNLIEAIDYCLNNSENYKKGDFSLKEIEQSLTSAYKRLGGLANG